MAGDWIAYCKDLPRKPKTLRIKRLTGCSLAETVFGLLEVWSWADSHSEDGELSGLTLADVAEICPQFVRDLSCGGPAFVAAMAEVGWLAVNQDGVTIPKFCRWMGKSGKRRLQDILRKRESRHKAAIGEECPQPVREPSANRPAKTRPTDTDTDTGERKKHLPSVDALPATASPSAGTEPALLTFPCDGKPKEWHLTASVLGELAEAYPSLDVLAEARKALAWVKAAGKNKKTAGGMRRFLTNWMGRSQDSGRGRSAQAQQADPFAGLAFPDEAGGEP